MTKFCLKNTPIVKPRMPVKKIKISASSIFIANKIIVVDMYTKVPSEIFKILAIATNKVLKGLKNKPNGARNTGASCNMTLIAVNKPPMAI